MADQLVYRVRTATTGWGGAPGLNTHYFLQDLLGEPDEAAAAADCANRVHVFFGGLTSMFPIAWKADVNPEVDVINTDNGDLVSSQVVSGLSQIAGISVLGFGPQVAMVCGNLVTSDILDGRRVKGRVFIGPSFEACDTDGTPQNAVVALVNDGLLDLRGTEVGHPRLVVWSRRRGVSGSHPTGLGGSAHLVTGVVTKDTFAILKSRRQ
jgi:hypothetical protein